MPGHCAADGLDSAPAPESRGIQIIDDRVYRIVRPGRGKSPAKPQKLGKSYLARNATIYFAYLDALHEHTCEALSFAEADRIMYQLDIELGNMIGG